MSGCCDKLILAVSELADIVAGLQAVSGQLGFETINVINNQTLINLSEIPNVAKMIPILDIDGSIPVYGIDYTITGNSLTWQGAYQLESSDKITITYIFT